jgi:anti-sigma factor RsiW
MLCRDVKRAVYFFLDGALADPTQRDFNSHLSLCPECEARTAFHRRLRTFLQKRLERINATAPARLKTRLTRSIRAFGAEWSR